MIEQTNEAKQPFRILSLDGGGAKGFFTLGVLREIEGIVRRPLCERFDLVFGTSTGAIIAALIALGRSIDEIHDLYKQHLPNITGARSAAGKSRALENLGDEVFGGTTFDAVKTGVGIVATRWATERPMIFKNSSDRAAGRADTFVPGFGCTISDAVQASCSAYPYFNRKVVTTANGDKVELFDGGYCANNPTLFAVADAIGPLARLPEEICVVSVGVGEYPKPRVNLPKRLALRGLRAFGLFDLQLLEKTLEINTQAMEQLRSLLFPNVASVRINEKSERPEMTTDFLERDLGKLNLLRQRGADTLAMHETALRSVLL